MWYFLVAVVVIVLVTLIVVMFQTNANRKRIRILETRQLELANHPQDDKMTKIETLDLSGESLKNYQKWSGAYHKLTTDEFNKIDQSLQAATDNNTFAHFLKSKQVITEIENDLSNAEKQMADISAAFDTILTRAKANQSRNMALVKQYEQLRKQLLTQSFAFGPAIDKLEAALAAIGKSFDLADTAKAKGDYLEEQSALDQVEKQIEALDANLIETRPLFAQIMNEFTPQLDEQQKGFNVLHKQSFRFAGIDIPGEIAKLRKYQEGTLLAIKNLELKTAKTRNGEQKQTIDHLYDVMQTEIDSQTFVNEQQDKLTRFFAHAQRQNQNLRRELDHLDKSYVLNDHEVADAEKLGKQLSELQNQFDADVQGMVEKKVIYSELAAHFKHYQTALQTIEKSQVNIHEKVSGLYEGEKVADNSAKQFEVTLRNIKRRVSQFNLPGLPKKYLDFFFVVSDEVNQLKSDLNQVKIDLDQITKQLILIQDDLDKLKQQSEDLIDSATLGQAMLQYANKLKADRPEVQTAIDSATDLFEHYDYPTALDRIATVVEQIEPGTYKKIEDSYYANKDDALG
ncbi:septation ring formation regulator EzrA [Agrilactobacillus fermenti]|uniref:septation ring formation regulator EzrA n=1 Tax=Agrilactobacillus fermenti TaxID=2586909 RepID=UPI001E55C6E8|nr:septation ring formation regulator EzrA [Agrilactobacillus fermenti]MCD2256474.1 hypothetical protein [Agrilactobacillus fermenti]